MAGPTRGLDALHELADAYAACDRCPALCEERNQVVFGSGAYDARVMVIAEAPGEDEDREGAPFVGESGQLLMDLFAHAWPETKELEDIRALDEDQEYFPELREFLDDYIFWTNVVLCRPPENRDPAPAEKKACRDRLERTIYAIDPLLIVGVGKVASAALLRSAVQITQKRGRIYDISIPSPITGELVRYPMLAILHPAFLLRKGDQDLMSRKKGNSYKTKEDLRWALDLLQNHHQYVFRTDFPLEGA